MSLKDFKPDASDFDPDTDPAGQMENPIENAAYREEINTLKIDKLSNRITIISIIIPCIIGAILVFSYLDIKERVLDVDETKNTQVERISKQLEEKLNALDVKIAKNRFDLNKQLPEITGRQTSLEGKLTKLSSSKIDEKTVKTLISKIERQISQNAGQDKALLKTIDGIKKNLSDTAKANKALFDRTAGQVSNEIKLFKEEFDARLLELSEYGQQTGELRKNFSLLDKKIRRLEKEEVSLAALNQKIERVKTELSGRMARIDTRVSALEKNLAANITRLQKDVDLLISSSEKTRPAPETGTAPSGPVNIEQSPLTQ